MHVVPMSVLHRLSRPVIATMLLACAGWAAVANLPQAVPLIALSGLSAIACMAPHK